MELNKLRFCGPLDYATPNCVIQEIAQSYKIKIGTLIDSRYRERVINYINNFKVDIIEKFPIESEISEIKKIATFMNSCVSWSYNKLKLAFNFWSQNQYQNGNFGLPTHLYPKSISPSWCYQICKNYNLSLDTTDQELYYYTKIIMNPDFMKSWLLQILQSENLITYFGEFKRYQPRNIPFFLTKQDFVICKGLSLEQLKNLEPKNHQIAVALGIMYFDVDLSFMESPISEYNILKGDKNSYLPTDIIIGQLYFKNPIAFKFSENFNPNISTEFYTYQHLQKIYKFEGYSTEDSIFEVLQLRSISNTFYSGFRAGIKNLETLITMEPLDHIENSEIICYGIINESLTAFTISEIIESFDVNIGFVLPDNNIPDDIAINKLFNIAKLLENIKLQDTIKLVRSYQTTKYKPIAKLIREYNKATPENKDKILKGASYLLDLGFKMRGWLGGEYPVVTCLVDDQIAVDLEISKSMLEFETWCKEAGSYGDLIKYFPLMKYINGFVFSTSTTDGFTVIERLEIVKSGDTTDNMSSCVRLTSNWICATAYKIYESLKLPLPFDIKILRSIS